MTNFLLSFKIWTFLLHNKVFQVFSKTAGTFSKNIKTECKKLKRVQQRCAALNINKFSLLSEDRNPVYQASALLFPTNRRHDGSWAVSQ